MGRQRQEDYWGLLASQAGLISNLRYNERPCLRRGKHLPEDDIRDVFWPLYAHEHRHMQRKGIFASSVSAHFLLKKKPFILFIGISVSVTVSVSVLCKIVNAHMPWLTCGIDYLLPLCRFKDQPQVVRLMAKHLLSGPSDSTSMLPLFVSWS